MNNFQKFCFKLNEFWNRITLNISLKAAGRTSVHVVGSLRVSLEGDTHSLLEGRRAAAKDVSHTAQPSFPWQAERKLHA